MFFNNSQTTNTPPLFYKNCFKEKAKLFNTFPF